MSDYNASDTRQIRAALKKSRAEREQDDGVLIFLMTNPAGRKWMWRLLGRTHAFHSPYTGDNDATNFQCGEQNIGLELIADLLRACPDQFIFMMREANDGERSNDNGRRGDSPDIRRDDSTDSGNGRVTSEYDPTESDADATVD